MPASQKIKEPQIAFGSLAPVAKYDRLMTLDIGKIVDVAQETNLSCFEALPDPVTDCMATRSKVMEFYSSDEWNAALAAFEDQMRTLDVCKNGSEKEIIELLKEKPSRLYYQMKQRLNPIGQMVFRGLTNALTWVSSEYCWETATMAGCPHPTHGNAHAILQARLRVDPNCPINLAMLKILPPPAHLAESKENETARVQGKSAASWSPIVDDDAVPHPSKKAKMAKTAK